MLKDLRFWNANKLRADSHSSDAGDDALEEESSEEVASDEEQQENAPAEGAQAVALR